MACNEFSASLQASHKAVMDMLRCYWCVINAFSWVLKTAIVLSQLTWGLYSDPHFHPFQDLMIAARALYPTKECVVFAQVCTKNRHAPTPKILQKHPAFHNIWEDGIATASVFLLFVPPEHLDMVKVAGSFFYRPYGEDMIFYDILDWCEKCCIFISEFFFFTF
jgi:hypothetical protein